MSEITQLLARAAHGEGAAANLLMPMIYDQLRAIAHRQLGRGRSSKTLATTALVNEAYLALFGEADLDWNDRGHFFAFAAKAMRNILIDRVRRRVAEKRGGEAPRVDIEDTQIVIDDDCVDLLALDQALTQMADAHPRLVQVVELRFFAGLSAEEVASSLNVDLSTVVRDWRKARAFLYRALGRQVRDQNDSDECVPSNRRDF